MRLPDYDYSQPGAYFVTIVTHQRQLLFEEGAIKAIVEDTWRRIPEHFKQVSLDAFVVMPNHVHGVLVISDVGAGLPRPSPSQGEETSPLPRPLLGQAVAYFKYQSAKRINQLRNTPGARVRQRNYYEHVVRSEVEFDRVRQYIVDNPARWELDPENPARLATQTPDDTPWSS